MSDLQRDIEQIESVVNYIQGGEKTRAAWQRIRPRLTPDRERVARAIFDSREFHRWEDEDAADKERVWYPMADAAIAAMGETP